MHPYFKVPARYCKWLLLARSTVAGSHCIFGSDGVPPIGKIFVRRKAQSRETEHSVRD